MWYSIFIGRKESDGLFNQAFDNVWIHSPYTGAKLDDEHSMFISGGEPYPSDPAVK